MVQRLKRAPTILQKLQRFPRMKLSRMQDIGGCRAVLTTVRQVRELEESFLQSRIKHHRAGYKDYISIPKSSGYRGVHLVYRYHSDRVSTWNTLRTELQFRTRRQHAWATAVETVGTLIRQSLKSSEGPEKWLEFFAHVSSGFALMEDLPRVPGVPRGKRELVRAIRRFARELDVRKRLMGYAQALQILGEHADRRDHFYLLVLRPEDGSLTIYSYRMHEPTKASEEYQRQESRAVGTGTEVVLVSAQSLEAVRLAYPNYFMDAQVFLAEMEKLVSA